MDSVGQEARWGTVGMSYFYPMLSGPSAGKTQMTGGISHITSTTLP